MHIVCFAFLLQGQVKEELQNTRSKVEELNSAKNDVEKNNSRLNSDLKALKEKSEKVCHHLYKWQKIWYCFYMKVSHVHKTFRNNGDILSQPSVNCLTVRYCRSLRPHSSNFISKCVTVDAFIRSSVFVFWGLSTCGLSARTCCSGHVQGPHTYKVS